MNNDRTLLNLVVYSMHTIQNVFHIFHTICHNGSNERTTIRITRECNLTSYEMHIDYVRFYSFLKKKTTHTHTHHRWEGTIKQMQMKETEKITKRYWEMCLESLHFFFFSFFVLLQTTNKLLRTIWIEWRQLRWPI